VFSEFSDSLKHFLTYLSTIEGEFLPERSKNRDDTFKEPESILSGYQQNKSDKTHRASP